MGSNLDAEQILAQGSARQPMPAGVRERIPALGLTEYWYPALPEARVTGKRPVKVTMLGQDLVFFRGENNQVAAVARACPHRGADLSYGDVLFKGTLTCPYHGWTFNAKGECLAVLGEGPQSEIPGTRGSAARAYPTRTLAGTVFVWMGEGEPAPIEEDAPPELFNGQHLIFTAERVWKANWRPSLENFSDAHVYFMHRNSIEMLTQVPAALQALSHSGPTRPQMVRVNDRALMFDRNAHTVVNYTDRAAEKGADGQPVAPAQFQDAYPALGGALWPPTRGRLYFSRICGFFRGMFKPAPAMVPPDSEWSTGVHLPCTIRVDYRRIMFTRFEVPVSEHRTNNYYFIAVRKGGLINQLFWRAYMRSYYLWKAIEDFSAEDGLMAEITDYTTPERLSATDRFPRDWRRFVLECARQPKRRSEEAEAL